MLDQLLEMIGTDFHLTGKDGSARQFQTAGMAFEARAYVAEGLGHVGVMTAQGPMRMETLLINPFELDAPIFSYDRIHAMGQEIVLAEMYDSLLGDSFRVDGLARALGEAAFYPDKSQDTWFAPMIVSPWLNQKGPAGDAERFDGIVADYVAAYLAAVKMAEPCDAAQKREKAAVYSEGLLKHGGPATDPVKAAMGEAFTADLFRNTLFGA